MPNSIFYLNLVPEVAPPAIAIKPTRFVIVNEAEASHQWVQRVSRWMIDSGCVYMMAWGDHDPGWEREVDSANIDQYAGREIPGDALVMTTTHDNESMEQVFWFSKVIAQHRTVHIARTIILHISATSRKDAMICQYKRARAPRMRLWRKRKAKLLAKRKLEAAHKDATK